MAFFYKYEYTNKWKNIQCIHPWTIVKEGKGSWCPSASSILHTDWKLSMAPLYILKIFQPSDKKVSLKGLDSTARRELPLHSSRIKERLDCVRFMKTWADICLPQSNLIPTPRALIKYKNLSTSSQLNIAKWLSNFWMNISASHVLHHLLFCTTHEEW